jgi:Uma2 family endonuclease
MTLLAPPYSASPGHIVLEGISWSTYRNLLRDLDQRPLRLTFDKGNLEIMPPLPLHEKWKGRIGRMIELVSLERRIEVEALGSTTFGREDLEKGLEPDECYYVAHALDVQGKDEIDLSVDPPPDLAIEVDITRRSVPRQPIYAALGIPELWRFDGSKLFIMKLERGQVYTHVAKSNVFPFLQMEQFEQFLLRMGRERQLSVLEDFRIWLHAL